MPNDDKAGATDLDPTITYADDKSPVLPLVDLKILFFHTRVVTGKAICKLLSKLRGVSFSL